MEIVAAYLVSDQHQIGYGGLVVRGGVNLDLDDQATFGPRRDEEWSGAIRTDPLDGGPLTMPRLAEKVGAQESDHEAEMLPHAGCFCWCIHGRWI